MHIDQDVRLIGPISLTKIKQVKDAASIVDWKHSKFDRLEESLVEGRLCTLPYPIRTKSQKEYTDSQLLLIDSAMPIVEEVLSYFPEFTPVRGEVVNLLPGKKLIPHIDIYWFHKYSKRIHVPIYTNNQCFQIFEDREQHLNLGFAYEINNRILHSARNNGAEPRIHIIIDLMPPDKILEVKKNRALVMQVE